MVVFLPFLIVIIFIIIYIQLLSRKNKTNKTNIKTVNELGCRKGKELLNNSRYDISKGKLSVIFDRKNNVTVIPFNFNYLGKGKATTLPLSIIYPYTNQILGENIKKAMEFSKKSDTISDKELMQSLGFNNWKEFSQGKRNISIHYDNGIVINTTTRKPDGSYIFNKYGFEKVLKADISEDSLGSEVLLALKKCR